MSVNVEWKLEDGRRGGIVAEGTYLWDAAKRLGVRLPAECEGRGECDTCAVVVEEGATLLSGLTEAERTRLSPERLAAGERLVRHVGLDAYERRELLLDGHAPELFAKVARGLFGRLRALCHGHRAQHNVAARLYLSLT